jgi:hypothetical protein
VQNVPHGISDGSKSKGKPDKVPMNQWHHSHEGLLVGLIERLTMCTSIQQKQASERMQDLEDAFMGEGSDIETAPS